MSAAKKSSAFDFEKALDQLNQLCEKMERGDLPLEESLKSFEQGVALIRQCQTALTEAEQKVKILTETNKLESFNPDDNS